MPQLATLTVNDGATTPVAHSFTPTDVQSGLATWHDRSGGVVVGFPRITAQLKLPTSNSVDGKNQNARVQVKVVMPVLEQTSASTGTGIQPAPTKGYDMTFNGEFVLPVRSTLQDRKHIIAYAKNFLAQALVTALVQDLESIY